MRFVQTVAYFNEWRPDRIFAKLAQRWGPDADAAGGSDVILAVARGCEQESPEPDTSIPISVDGVILVTGATGGVGRRVVARLLLAGKAVRALVRDTDKARDMLADLPVAKGGRLEVVAADLAQRATLVPDMFEGVAAVISCHSVKVVPKEGDTVDRAKYYQGIQFYDPTISGDTPQVVEAGGMRNLTQALIEHASIGTAEGVALLRSSSLAALTSGSSSTSSGDGCGPLSTWGALDDVVMGGVSKSGFGLEGSAGQDGQAAWVFSGNVSTDNFGGFASVRTKNLDPPVDLGAYASGGIKLRLLGDGQRYKFILRPDANWDGVAYCASFDTRPGQWQDICLAFADFFPVFRARRISTLPGTSTPAPPLDPSSISSLQLMLSKFEYDGQLNPSFIKGAFRLPISDISAYLGEQAPPRFVHISSAGVTRPNRPGIDVSVEPPAVKMNDALGGLLTYKLEAEDVLRASGLPVAIVRPCALTEEPRGMPLQLDQGDTIKGKVSRDDVAEMCCALLDLPQATGVTFEVKSTIPFSQPWTGAPGAAGLSSTAAVVAGAGALGPDGAPVPCVGPRDWPAVLGAAQLKRGVTGRTVQGVYTGKLPEVEALRAAGMEVQSQHSANRPAAVGAASGAGAVV